MAHSRNLGESEMTMPKVIRVVRVWKYDTDEVCKEISEMNGEPATDAEVLDLITEWTYEDFYKPVGEGELMWLDDETGEQVNV